MGHVLYSDNEQYSPRCIKQQHAWPLANALGQTLVKLLLLPFDANLQELHCGARAAWADL
jgi:hypothetical protein